MGYHLMPELEEESLLDGCVCMFVCDKNSLKTGIGPYSVINQQGQTKAVYVVGT